MRFYAFLLLFLLPLPATYAQPDCNPNHRPVVFVHGFLASGDTWSSFSRMFRAVGYCPDRLVVYDWNTLNQQANHSAALDVVIDAVRARTGAAQVDLVGHSAGGGLGYSYLSDSVRAAKVAHYVHIGSMNQKQPAGPTGKVPTLNLWSDGDRVVPGKDIPGAVNIMLPDMDHYQVATSVESFLAACMFFHEMQLPDAAEWKPSERVRIGGRAVFFGDNKPAAGAAVELHYLDPKTGVRAGNVAAALTADEQGYWSVTDVQGGVPIELVLRATPEARPVHYFREGFAQPHDLVYLRALPGPNSMVGLMLAGLPNTPAQSVLNVYIADQAVVFGRDSLAVNGIPLSTEQHTAAEKTAISFFLYDSNNNQQSDLSAAGMFGRFPFLTGVDVFLNPDDPAPVEVYFNGKRQVVRKIPSSTGVQVVVFD